MDAEYSEISVESISFSPMNLFLCFGYITGEVHLYSLINELDNYFKRNSNKNVICNCLDEFEKELKERDKPTSLSFFGKIVKFKNYLFEKPKKSLFGTLIFQSSGKHYISYFEKRNEITFISDNLVQKFKFSSAEGGRGWCFKSIIYNKNEKLDSSSTSKLSSFKSSSSNEDYDFVNDANI